MDPGMNTFRKALSDGPFGIGFRFGALFVLKLSDFPKKNHFGIGNPERSLLKVR